MFDTVLVADRGLLACRVVRTCQRLGARTVTVHSETDSHRLHAACADESLLLGPGDPASSYLDGLKVIEAARQAGAQALHPGAGPHARSAAFASAVQDAGLSWIGPPPEVLAALPASGEDASNAVLVMLLGSPERQVVAVADSTRRGGLAQSPAAVPADVREAARSAAVAAAADAGVVGLAQAAVDPSRGFTVTRLSPWLPLDHAVVELVTGADLVELQVRTALGRGIEAGLDAPRGAAAMVALRSRTARRLNGWKLPEAEHLRVDLGHGEGEHVSPGDGPLLTLAAWGADADEAHARLEAARAELVADGIDLEEST